MVNNSFSKIIEEFDPMDLSKSLELKRILNSYPYFQSASAHYLKTLKFQKKDAYSSLYGICSSHRKRTFRLGTNFRNSKFTEHASVCLNFQLIGELGFMSTTKSQKNWQSALTFSKSLD